MSAGAVTVEARRVVHFNRRSRRPLQDRTEYTVREDGRDVIKVTNRAEVLRLVRRRYGADAAVDFVEVAP